MQIRKAIFCFVCNGLTFIRRIVTLHVIALLSLVGLVTAANAEPGALRFAHNAGLQPHQSSELIGANLSSISDYSGEHVFVDLVKQSRKFGTVEVPYDDQAKLGEDGWPLGDFGLFVMTLQKNVSGTGGLYTISFTGQAKIATVASDAIFTNQHYNAESQSTTLEMRIAQGADQLLLRFTNTGPGIKNLKIIRPGYDALDPPLFTTEYLNHIQRFKTVRFMNWSETNNSKIQSWQDRPTESTHYYSADGLPWEYMIELANLTHQDIWINIPAMADDGYVLQLAKLLESTLNPSSKIYVEYSNEVWNAQFAQFGQNHDAAIAYAQRHPEGPGITFDGDTNEWTLTFRRVAQRTKEIGDIFKSVFGETEMMSRIRPVLGGQVVRPALAQIGLDYLQQAYGSAATYVYALAGAPYFNMGPQQRVEGLSPTDVLNAFSRSIDDIQSVNHFQTNIELAHTHGIRFFAYEGGSDTFGPGSIEAKRAASMDPRFEPLCRRYLQTWFASGGDLFMWFVAGAGQWTGPFGTWELTTDLSLTDAPKIKCLDALIADRSLIKNRWRPH
jgi:hypothetical protein